MRKQFVGESDTKDSTAAGKLERGQQLKFL